MASDEGYVCPQCGTREEIDPNEFMIGTGEEYDGKEQEIVCYKCSCRIPITTVVEFSYKLNRDKFTRAFLRMRGYMGPMKAGLDYYLERFLDGNKNKNESIALMDSAFEIVNRHFDMPIGMPWSCSRCEQEYYPWDLKLGLPNYPVCERCESELGEKAALKMEVK